MAFQSTGIRWVIDEKKVGKASLLVDEISSFYYLLYLLRRMNASAGLVLEEDGKCLLKY